jgi:hypothetical protein
MISIKGRREPTHLKTYICALFSACTPDPPTVGKQAARLLAGDARLSDLQHSSSASCSPPIALTFSSCPREPLLLAAVLIGGVLLKPRVRGTFTFGPEHKVPAECEDHGQNTSSNQHIFVDAPDIVKAACRGGRIARCQQRRAGLGRRAIRAVAAAASEAAAAKAETDAAAASEAPPPEAPEAAAARRRRRPRRRATRRRRARRPQPAQTGYLDSAMVGTLRSAVLPFFSQIKTNVHGCCT